MTDETSMNDGRSIDTVIRGFTDAELALREVSGAVERLRSASEQLDASRADQLAARETLSTTEAAVRELVTEVGSLKDEVGALHATLRELEPSRLWRELGEHVIEIRQGADRAESAVTTAKEALETRLDQEEQAMRRLTRLVGVGVIAIVLILGVVVALAVGALPVV